MESRLPSMPQEILLAIVSYLTNPLQDAAKNELPGDGPTEYYHDIYNVALSCKKISIVARDVLLSGPIFVPFAKLDRLVHTYLRYPHFATRPRSLEVVTGYNKSLNVVNDPFGWPKVDDGFERSCIEVIRKLDISEANRNDWIASLRPDKSKLVPDKDFIIPDFKAQDTFFGLLLVMLPNLQELYLGTLHIVNVPVLQDLIWDRRTDIDWPSPKVAAWYSGYLLNAMLLVAPRLTHLELPLRWPDMSNAAEVTRTTERPNITESFINLKTLTVNPRVLESGYLLSAILPASPLFPNLRHLNIVGDYDFNFVESLPNLAELIADGVQPMPSELQGIDIFQVRPLVPWWKVRRSVRKKALAQLANAFRIRIRVHHSSHPFVDASHVVDAVDYYMRSRAGGECDLKVLPETEFRHLL
ncbi:unnamed protein product [Periconia digitata]|uniref:F-box domain-containing protein n=1 Tax=Periconia digitata TaxID=1303443 RepID=A0A9W4XQP8_9PLEO|nr:unnamed protein product [Periconia digitata]